MRHGLSVYIVAGLIITVVGAWNTTILADDGAVQLTFHPATDRFPGWSPDATQIVFESTRADTLDKWNLHNPWHYTKDYADWRERFTLACEVAGVPMSLYSGDTYIYEGELDV